jgi:predicted O-methyltransferase YrrM
MKEFRSSNNQLLTLFLLLLSRLIGTFTGYATACFLEGAKNVGEAIAVNNGNISGGPYVMTMERDGRALNLASAHLRAMTEYGVGEAGAEAVCSIRNNVEEVEEDIISVSLHGIAGCDILRVTDALAKVEEMAAGKSDLQPVPFDLVFVDADKTRLLDYVEACLSSDRVLKRGGLIVVDNTLWKGLVLQASAGEFSSVADTDTSGKDEIRKNRRARKLATMMHRFNAAIVQDDRVEVQLFPMRDGLSVIRKR